MKVILTNTGEKSVNWDAYGLRRDGEYVAHVKSLSVNTTGSQSLAFSIKNSQGFFHDVSKLITNEAQRTLITVSQNQNIEEKDCVFEVNPNFFNDVKYDVDVYVADTLERFSGDVQMVLEMEIVKK